MAQDVIGFSNQLKLDFLNCDHNFKPVTKSTTYHGFTFALLVIMNLTPSMRGSSTETVPMLSKTDLKE